MTLVTPPDNPAPPLTGAADLPGRPRTEGWAMLSAHDPHALAGLAPAQTAAWDAFWNDPSLDDAGTSHETTPIQRLHPGVVGMRDTLVSDLPTLRLPGP